MSEHTGGGPHDKGDAWRAEMERLLARLREGTARLSNMAPLGEGVTPRETVHSEDRLRLYRFTEPTPPQTAATPLLIVFALVNRWYVLDMEQERSLVRALRAGGREVYVIDWGEPLRGDRWLRMGDYINGYLDRCVAEVCARHGVAQLDLLGVCQGGTFSLCYAALHPERVRRLITMVTPVDFHTPDNHLSRWARSLDVDLLVDTLGNVPGSLLNAAFVSLQPFNLLGRKYLEFIDGLEEEARTRRFLAMERWIYDSPDQAGETFRQFVRDLFQRNLLVRGELSLEGAVVDLKRVSMPVFNVYADRDHLVPPAASKALAPLVGSDDYSEHAFAGGHIGIYVGGRSSREIPPLLLKWLTRGDAASAQSPRRRVSPRRR